MLDGARSMGLVLELGEWPEERILFCVAAIGFAFPPAVHEHESMFFRRSGFNPTVLIRISSLSQHHPLLLDLEESCGATLLAFSDEFTPVRSNASKSEGRKYHRLPSWHPGIWPLRAMRFTVFGCSLRNRAASVESQTGSGVEDAISMDRLMRTTASHFSTICKAMLRSQVWRRRMFTLLPRKPLRNPRRSSSRRNQEKRSPSRLLRRSNKKKTFIFVQRENEADLPRQQHLDRLPRDGQGRRDQKENGGECFGRVCPS